MTKTHRLPYRIINDCILFKKATESTGFLKKPPAICIDKTVFDDSLQKGIRFVQVFGSEEAVYYSCPVETFQRRSFVLNRGYGFQMALALPHWLSSKSALIPQSPTVAPPIKKLPSQQLSLFAQGAMR